MFTDTNAQVVSGAAVANADGAVAALIRAGVSPQIILPIIPWNMSLKGDGVGKGKAPAYLNAVGGWESVKRWQQGGVDAEWLRRSDAAGANAGLLLCALNGADPGAVQFVAIDIDLLTQADGRAVMWRNEIIRMMREIIGQDLQVRETAPDRVLFLIGLPGSDIGGAKKKFIVSHVNPADRAAEVKEVGAFEVLARGQQAVMAGRHWTDREIRWFKQTKIGPGNGRTAAPDLSGVPMAKNFEEVETWVVALLETLAPFGFSYRINSEHDADVKPALAEIAAPDIVTMIALLNATPNPSVVDRDMYVNFMHAIGGARAGLKARKGAIPAGDEIELGNAVAAWASRWKAAPGKTAGTLDSEYTKWTDDFVRPRDDYYSGWPQMVRYAAKFGAPQALISEIAGDAARDEFGRGEDRPAEDEAPQVKAPQGATDLFDLPPDDGTRNLDRPYRPEKKQGVSIDHGITDFWRAVGNVIARHPRLFWRAGRLMAIGLQPDRPQDAIPCLIEWDDARVCFAASELIYPYTQKKKDGTSCAPEPCAWPPNSKANIYAIRREWNGLRGLTGITHAPWVTESGEIIDRYGYDAGTRLFFSDVPALTVPDRPTHEDAKAALGKLRDHFKTLAFADAPKALSDHPALRAAGIMVVDTSQPPAMDESAFLNCLGNACIRQTLPHCPGALFTGKQGGPGSGAGKGLAARLIVAIATGLRAGATSTSPNKEEFDKRLIGEILSGRPVLFFDNINSTSLHSDTLASLMTENPVQVRRLGKSEIHECESTAFVVLTGNGLEIVEDLLRRFYEVRFDANMQNASTRDFSGIPDILDSTFGCRGALLTAMLTIIRWHAQGCAGLGAAPARGLPLGSFEKAARMVRDALLNLGCADPVQRMHEAREADEEAVKAEEFFVHWHFRHGLKPVTAGAVHQDIGQLLTNNAAATPRTMGRALSKKAGMIAGGARFDRERDTAAGGQNHCYRLVIQDEARWEQTKKAHTAQTKPGQASLLDL